MNAVRPLEVLPRKRKPLAQVELLVLFHPTMQTGGPGRVKAMPQNCAQGWVTLDVYGRPGTSEISGLPIIEDMRLEADGEDIEALLPDNVVNDIAAYVADNT